jgi:hypothetical protein
MNDAAVYFYSPSFPSNPNDLPQTVEDSWSWYYETRKREMATGEYAWTLQTFLHLKQAGIMCEATNTIPKSGIIFAHRNALPYLFLPSKDQLLVCLQADKSPHPFVQASVVLTEASLYMRWMHMGPYTNPLVLWHCRRPYADRFYIKHWPIPNLKPRDRGRGDMVKNVAYLGVQHSLAPELQTDDWKLLLEKNEFSWIWKNGSSLSDWTDFSEIDVIVSVRSFEQTFHHWASKPPTKLFNSWLAGVIPIMGNEASVQEVRKSDLDYIEVNSRDDILRALKRLRNEPEFRESVLKAGKERGLETSAEAIRNDWIILLGRLQERYKGWNRRTAIGRSMFFLSRGLSLLFDKVCISLRLYKTG